VCHGIIATLNKKCGAACPEWKVTGGKRIARFSPEREAIIEGKPAKVASRGILTSREVRESRNGHGEKFIPVEATLVSRRTSC